MFTLKESLSLIWLRRDLRLHDHAALAEGLKHRGRIQPIFIFDTDILARFTNPHDRRLSFIMEALIRIHKELKQQGGGLLVLYGRACEIVPKLTEGLDAGQVFTAEDYEPQTIERDAQVAKQVRLTLVKDHLIFSPREVLKSDGTPYKVFTPYSRAWRALVRQETLQEKCVSLEGRLESFDAVKQKIGALTIGVVDLDKGVEQALSYIGYTFSKKKLWSAYDANNRLELFISEKIEHYKHARDMVAIEGTSALSPYLRFGLVSVRECARLAVEQHNEGAETWLNELIWRDFYAMILFHYPETATQEFIQNLRGKIEWNYEPKTKERFFVGMTGYPVVDAAMRQLLETGWMHNRARMIVASFATKDLLMDWRLGEEHFAQYLMDYDMASNVGGWQWAASTGTDAQPWFRVFNPLLQSRKFDPDGDYIRRFVPEIAHLDSKAIHEAHLHVDASVYPRPIVNHDIARKRTLEIFKEAAGT